MHLSFSELFLLAALIVFAAPYLVWRTLRTEHWAPLVVVQIVCGILLGPGVLGALFPAQHQALFTPRVIDALSGVAWWAVMLFVWSAGVELDLREVWRRRSDTVVTAGLALVAPMLLGGLAGLLLLQFPGWLGANGRPWQLVLGVGMSCAVTALPILVLFLQRLGVLRTPFGQRVLAYASLDDVVIWAVLVLILLDWERLARQLLFLVLFAPAVWCVRALMRRAAEPDRWFLSLIWVLGAGLAADWSGLHFMVGAFLAGLVLDKDWFEEARFEQFRHTVLIAFMPVFFLSTGLRTSFGLGGAAVFGAGALLLAAAVGGKLLGVAGAGKLLRWPKGEALIIGLLLQTKALIMIIFANILLDRGVISAATFTALLLMAVASTMLTIPAVTPRLARLVLPGEGTGGPRA